MDQLRIQEGSKIFKACADYGLDASLAMRLEASAWSSSAEHGTLNNVPIWTYKSGNFDQIVFPTSRPDVHTRAFTNAYLSQIEKVLAMLEVEPMRARLAAEPLWFFEATETELETLCEYGKWKESHLKDLKMSKQVLEERDDSVGEFIQCRRCKSHAVDTEQKQTRSADEPMTLFCMCRKCGLRFTMH